MHELALHLSGVRRRLIGGFRTRHWRTHKLSTSFTHAKHEGEQCRRLAQEIRAIMKADGSWPDFLASGKSYSDLRSAELSELRIIRAMAQG